MSKRDENVAGISYAGLHMKIQKRLGKPNFCEICKSDDPSKKYEWANKDHTYSDRSEDWLRLCRECHINYDQEMNSKMSKKTKTICKTCGREMEIRNTQKRKKMCTECAYDLKKARSSERYWSKKAPNSTRHQFWEGRLREMEKMLNK